ncbi:MAG: hypothetical protein ACU837_01190 [Gammaproteobacteria bacterium]
MDFDRKFFIAAYRTVLVLMATAALIACNAFGPDSLRGTHALYNDAINGSMNEQFLQNVVRLHYRDPIFFLDVSSVTASLKLDFSAGLDQSQVGLNGGSDIIKYSFGGAYTTAPTISYAPLQGENFVKSVLSPISLQTIFTLASSGWNVQRVFGLCVERINDLENVPSASGPTPAAAPIRVQAFNRLLQLLEEIHRDHLIIPRVDPQTKAIQLELRTSPERREQVREIKALLGLDPNLQIFRVDSDFFQSRPDTISIRTRPMMSIYFYLSQHVDTPQAHQNAGLVTVTRNADGSEFDWGSTPGGRLFHVLQSNKQPESASLVVPYRDHWYYVADNDLESKSTFMLLTQLFRLRAGAAKTAGPTLTIPAR